MRKRDRKELERYLRWAANEIGLRDWTVELMAEPCDDENLGVCEPTYGRKWACIWIHRDFRDKDPEVQRDTIVHELVHCHLAPLQHMIEDETLQNQMGSLAFAPWNTAAHLNLEYAVDALAGVIAPNLPLIDWPD